MASNRKVQRRWLRWWRWENRISKLSPYATCTGAHIRAYNRIVMIHNAKMDKL